MSTDPIYPVERLDSGVLAAPYIDVPNPDASLGEGSSHDDATAQRLGFRGGTVAGSHHMNLVAPLAVHAFGNPWFEHGNASLYFRNATIDREAVQASMAPPTGAPHEQVDLWMRTPDDRLVAEGTLAIGAPAIPSALGRIPITELDPAGRRILADIEVGEAIPPTPMRVSKAEHDARLELAAAVMPWSRDTSPWGPAVLIPSSVVGLLYQPCVRSARGKAKPCTGIFGAIEIRNVNGPALVDTDYTVHGKVLAMGLSPKTELFWYETYADDAQGRRVVEMRMLIRMLKASSTLWDAASEA